MTPSLKSRAQGAIWGACVGDALGGPVQFADFGSFEEVKDLLPVYPFNMPSGAYSDDGAMTLGLAQSFIDSRGRYDQERCIANYIDWMRAGNFGTATWPWDIGVSTQRALTIWHQFGATPSSQQRVNRELDKEVSCGNGSLMRIAPVGVIFWQDEARAIQVAREESMVTHPAFACVEACVLFTSLVTAAMRGQTKDQLFGVFRNGVSRLTHPTLSQRLGMYISSDHFRSKESRQVQSSGWVIDTIEVSLWAFFKYNSWEEGALAVVNLGGDSDTAGAIYGALAGVHYGFEAIPQRWISKMQNAQFINDVASKFASVVNGDLN